MSALQDEIRQAVSEAIQPLVEKIEALEAQLVSKRQKLSTKEKAARLGITPDALRKRANKGLVPFERDGKLMWFNPEQ